MRDSQKALTELYSRIILEENGRKVIQGNVYLDELYLKELPEWLVDVEITGDFDCSDNLLTSHKSSPKKVRSDFICSKNKLTTLEGGPVYVGVDFKCIKK